MTPGLLQRLVTHFGAAAVAAAAPLDLSVTMFDSTNPDDIPDEAQIVAGYVDGPDKWPAEGWARFAHAYRVGITIEGTRGVRVGDCEPGALWPPPRAAKWGAGEIAAGLRPTLYVDLANLGDLVVALAGLGVSSAAVDWWLASWGGGPHRIGTSVATQYASPVSSPPSPGHYDLSLTNGTWPAGPVPPKPTPPEDETMTSETLSDGKVAVYTRDPAEHLLMWVTDPVAIAAGGAIDPPKVIDLTAEVGMAANNGGPFLVAD